MELDPDPRLASFLVVNREYSFGAHNELIKAKIQRWSSNQVEIEKSDTPQYGQAIAVVVAVGVILWCFFGQSLLSPSEFIHKANEITETKPMAWMFMLIAFSFLAIPFWQYISPGFTKNIFKIDGISKTIIRNGRQLASFNGVKQMELIEVTGEAMPSYDLFIIAKKTRPIWLASGDDLSELSRFADEIASIVGTKVERRQG